MRLAVAASHPIQYQAPLFRKLASALDLMVFYAHRPTPKDQAAAGFGVGFDWDVDLLGGYGHKFLKNVAKRPGLDHFSACDTPEIAEELRGGEYDALLVMGWHLKAFLQAIWTAKRINIPVLVRGDSQLETPRSTCKRLTKSLMYPPLLRVFDVALYVGERSRRYWEHYAYPDKRLFFSPHSVDTDWFAGHATREAREALRTRLAIAKEAKVVLFAGKLMPFKRPLDVVYAADVLRRGGLDLTILVAGDGPLSGEMIAAARRADITLHHLGFCNQTAMPAAYSAADVLVLPSDARETWGLVANEALACGCPVVVSDACGCAPDLAADRRAGQIFPIGQIRALAAALQEVLARPPPRDLIAAKSAQYSLSAASNGIEEALAFLQQKTHRSGAYGQ